MSDAARFVEVLGHAMIERTIETYRARITLTVNTRKRHSGLDESTKWRQQIVEAIVSAGIAAEDIEEAGGAMSDRSWSPRKEMIHELSVTSRDMTALSQAMQNVERMVAQTRESWLSGIKHDVTFDVPEPMLTLEEEATEKALQDAVIAARRKAERLATECGVALGELQSITEIAVPPRPQKKRYFPAIEWNEESCYLNAEAGTNGDQYAAAAPRRESGRLLFRFRFAIA